MSENESTSGTVRAFVAVDIGETVRAALAPELADLRRRWPRVRWVAPGNLHLTLAFLGHLYPEQTAAAAEALAAVAVETRPFDLSFEGLGRFGALRAPRVIWVGIGAGAEALKTVQARLAEGLRCIGLVPEDRPFMPHLTIGRVKASGDAPGLGDWLDRRAPRAYGSVRVEAVALMRSDLRPAGPLYTTLKTAPFQLV